MGGVYNKGKKQGLDDGFRGSHWRERRPLRKTLTEEAMRISEYRPEAFTKVSRDQDGGECKHVQKDRWGLDFKGASSQKGLSIPSQMLYLSESPTSHVEL